MNIFSPLLFSALLLTSLGVMEANADPSKTSGSLAEAGNNGGLPALIKEKEKGVFYLRVLNKEGEEISSGTAFLVDRKGTLVTALHVILPKTEVVGSLEALSVDGKKWKVAGVSASDESVDLAVLKLAEVPKGARPLELAGDKLPVRGDKALALGHPQGFQFVATDGMVSATHKTDQLPARFRQSGFIHSAPDVVWIQTSAAVSSGNSGGPLLDASGKVIGVIQWSTRGQGMNFALHVASVRKLLARPQKLVSLQAFTQPRADFHALMMDLVNDRRQYQMSNRVGFGFPSGKPGNPAAKDPVPKYVPALVALADTYRGNDIELEILTMLMRIGAEKDCSQELTPDVKKASERLIGQYCDDRRLVQFLRSRPEPTLLEAQRFLALLSRASSDAEIRGLSALACAQSIDVNANGGKLRESALKLARAAALCPPEITLGPGSLAKVAGELVDKLTHSVAGCPAPALAGTDQHGKPVGPADLKGQHTVVAFYTAQSEFQTGVARQLNDLVKYGEGRPLSVIGVLVEDPGMTFSSSGSRVVQKTWRSLKDDADGALRKGWHISDAPTVLLIDPKGMIKGRFENRTNRSGMGFADQFASSFFTSLSSSGPPASKWKEDLMTTLKGIPELETEAEKRAKLPNRLAASPLDPSLLKGLVLRYSFDQKVVGTIRDASGKAHHAKATGGEWTDDPKTGGCYKLSKPGDQIVSSDYGGVTGANPRTVSFWFKSVGTPQSSSVSFLRWGVGNKMGANFALLFGKKRGMIVDVSSGQQFSDPVRPNLLDGKWHHIAITLSRGGMLRDIGIYIDGKPMTTSPNMPGRGAPHFFRTQPIATAPGIPVTIGPEHLSGFMDEVMIWDRALDGVEIARLYKATGGQKLDPALESAILRSNKLSTEDEPAAKKTPAAAGNAPETGAVKFSDWLKTVRFRSDNGIQLFIEGDMIRLSGIKGFKHRIDEESRIVTWGNSGKPASVAVNPDRKSGVWTNTGGVKHRVTVVPRK